MSYHISFPIYLHQNYTHSPSTLTYPSFLHLLFHTLLYHPSSTYPTMSLLSTRTSSIYISTTFSMCYLFSLSVVSQSSIYYKNITSISWPDHAMYCISFSAHPVITSSSYIHPYFSPYISSLVSLLFSIFHSATL
jgi:hypothetical protein